MELTAPERTKELLDRLEQENPDALLIGTDEEREKYGYDRAIVDLAPAKDRRVHNDRWADVDIGDPDRLLAVYDYDLLVEVFVAESDPPHEDYDPYEAAVEWVDFNVLGSWMGPNTPIIACRGEDEDVGD